MNKRLFIIVVCLWSLAYCAGAAEYASPFDPGAVRKTDQAARVDTINASFTGDIDVARDVGAATVNGVAPLTAAEKTQALVGSPTVDFLANKTTYYGNTLRYYLTTPVTMEHVLYAGNLSAVGSTATFTFACISNTAVSVKTTVSGLSGADTPIYKELVDSFYLTPTSGMTGGIQSEVVAQNGAVANISLVWSWTSSGLFKAVVTNLGPGDFKNVCLKIKFLSSRANQFVLQ